MTTLPTFHLERCDRIEGVLRALRQRITNPNRGSYAVEVNGAGICTAPARWYRRDCLWLAFRFDSGTEGRVWIEPDGRYSVDAYSDAQEPTEAEMAIIRATADWAIEQEADYLDRTHRFLMDAVPLATGKHMTEALALLEAEALTYWGADR